MSNPIEVVGYDNLREKVADGDIVFVRGKDTLIARIIRQVTKSRYSHVGMAFWVGEADHARLCIVEAQLGNTRRIVHFSTYRTDKLEVLRPVHRTWEDMKPQALGSVGVAKYSLLSAMYIGLREMILRKTNIALPLYDLPGEICSEFIAQLMLLRETNISPEQLHKDLQTYGLAKVLYVLSPYK